MNAEVDFPFLTVTTEFTWSEAIERFRHCDSQEESRSENIKPKSTVTKLKGNKNHSKGGIEVSLCAFEAERHGINNSRNAPFGLILQLRKVIKDLNIRKENELKRIHKTKTFKYNQRKPNEKKNQID